MTDDKRDTYAQTDKEIYEEARDFLRLCEDAESDNRSRGLEAKKFRKGGEGQWQQDLYAARKAEGGRLSLTINHTDTFVTRVENSMKQQRPRIKCHPVGQQSTVDKADLVNGLTRHVENRSQASIAYDSGGSSALTIGWGYWRLLNEFIDERSMDQELRIAPILNAFTVYRDPNSVLPDGSDSMRYLISRKQTRKEHKLEHPGEPISEWQPGGNGDDLNWESHDNIRLAEYYRIITKPEKLFKMKDGSTLFEHEFAPGVLEEALKDPLKHGFQVEQTGPRKGQAIQRPSTFRQVQWFKLNGRKVIDQRDFPPEHIKHIPIVAVEGNVMDINGRRTFSGMIENLMEPARMVNIWESMKTERLGLSSKSQWTAYEGVIEGHNEWHEANVKNFSVLVGKAVTGPNGELLPLPTKQAPAQIEAGMSEAMQSAYSALMAMAGQPHEPGQDAKGEVISGVALQERRELADITHFQYYDNQTHSIAFTGRLMLEWFPLIYSTERMQRIIGEDGMPSMVKINEKTAEGIKNDLTVGEYDIVMDTGPGYDTKRQEGAEAMIDLLKTPLGEPIAKVGSDLIVRNMDFAGSSDLADRLMPLNPAAMQKAVADLPKQAQAIVAAMQQETQQLKQALQEAQMELKYKTSVEHGWMQVEREKTQVKAEVDTRNKHTDALVKKHSDEVGYDKAINVAEINAGARLIDSNQDRAHEKELAETIAASAEKAEKSNGTH
jgi:hypothetical protein